MSETTAQKAFRLCGQSLWYDNISRSLLRTGGLAKLRDAGVRGVTSNPSIFQKAFASDQEYQGQMQQLAAEGLNVESMYYALVLDDIREACDIFQGLYQESRGVDGFVSVEVLPSLASETDETLQEALRLAKQVDRPNVMIKIPGTDEGFPAVEEAIANGVSINITLLFSVDQYKKTAEAYLRGLERRLEQGLPIDRVASVASFFVSRVDSAVDPQLEAELATRTGAEADRIRKMLGRTGIANSKMAYQHFLRITASERWRRLADAGAKPQRLLWGSTGTKNPAYPDTLYVDELLGPDTVNTVPPATLDAFLDHGKVESKLTSDIDGVIAHLEKLTELGIDLDKVCRKLLKEGVDSFSSAMDSLLQQLESRRKELI